MPPLNDRHQLPSQRATCEDLLSQLDSIEQAGTELFQKLQQALMIPYPLNQAQDDLTKLTTTIEKFQDSVIQSGHLGTSINSPNFKVMAECGRWNDDRNKRSLALAEDLKRIADNTTAAMSVDGVGSHSGQPM
ncbi:hypothetical protein H4R33_006552 [Dimargaris cristalligena]|nr:hypothetical protein H4R33_006552 [Dimargaris cristalligena]